MNIKEELEKLYMGWKVYGPYLRKEDQRTYFVRVQKDEEGFVRRSSAKISIMRSRAIMEIHLGRILDRDEEVDHKDGNRCNDVIENLQLLSLEQHREKSGQENSIRNPPKISSFICPVCDTPFRRRNHLLSPNSTVYVCSRSCLHIWSSKTRTKHNQYSNLS